MTTFPDRNPDPTPNQERWTQLSLICLGLMLTVPFLHPVHHHPIPSFYGEWWAMVLGLLAAIAALMAAPLRLILPSTLKLIAILLVAVLLQWFSGMVAYSEFALFHSGYLAWGAIVATLGATLAGRIGRDRLFQCIATAILVGALISTAIAIAQRLSLPISHQIMFPPIGGRVGGNIAQPNKLASYLWAGIVAVLYLREQGKLAAPSTLACVILLGSAAGLTGSRLALLYGAALMIAALVVYRASAKSQIQGRILNLGAAMLALLYARSFFSSLPSTVADTAGNSAATSALERLGGSNFGGDARFDIWRDTLTLIGDHPWIGNGVGNFPWRMVEAASRAPEGANTRAGAEHAHNIFLQVAADFGLPVMTLFCVAIVLWLLRLRATRIDPNTHYALAGLIVLALYSLVEYPLWSADLLGIFCLLVGAIDPRIRAVAYPARRPVLPLALAVGVLALLPLKLDYERLDDATNRFAVSGSSVEWQQRVDTVAAVATTSGLGSYAYIALAAVLEPEQKLAPQQLQVCERAMRLWPDAVIIVRCAYLRHLNGRTAEGQELLNLARAAYREPSEHATMAMALELAAKKNPDASIGVFLSL